ncbi:MAG: hypothetical protein U5R06_06175 [candidate division KSB1 bacterium]|nr:hypothetical protein [candidate division KSB1 bacterium]
MGTENPRKAPSLEQLWVRYFFYDSDIDPAPRIYTTQIPGSEVSTEDVSIKWNALEYKQVLPNDPAERDKVRFSFQIVDYETGSVLISDLPWRPENTVTLDLSQYTALNGIKRIYLNAFPYTTAQYLTPKLRSWRITYQLYDSTPSNIQFVGPDRTEVESYTGTTSLPPENESENPGKVYIMLDDRNLEQSQSSIDMPVKAVNSGDIEHVTLSLTAPFQAFSLIDPVPIRIVNGTALVHPENDTLEVSDRDLITVSYQDPDDPTDRSQDTVTVIMGTKGEIYIENSKAEVLSTAHIGDSLYARVTGEHDKNLNTQGADSIVVVLRNSVINDSEFLYLYELKNDAGIENTGNFRSSRGLLLNDDKNWAPDDSVLFAQHGDVIQAVYTDNFTLVSSVSVPDQEPVDDDFSDTAYKLQIAPNPFRESTHGNFRLRIFSTVGNLTLDKLEIFNLSGQRVRQIQGDEITISNAANRTIEKNRYGIIENWWDLSNNSGHKISSGTYWGKIHRKACQ